MWKKKNSFLNFLIVSHHRGSTRWVKVPIIFFVLLFFILILTGIFFLNNLNRYIDISSVGFLHSDNQRLREKVLVLSKERERLKTLSDSLLLYQKEVLKKHHIKGLEESKEEIYPLDSLTNWSKWIDEILKSSLKIRDSLLSMIPSILPVEGYVIKDFGEQFDPFTEKMKPHNGINILTNLNTPVIVAANGRVIEVGYKKGAGLFVEVAHWRNFITLYGQLLSTTVKKGEQVMRGDIIGYVGKSGRAPYPYLYYEVRKDSVYINPKEVIFNEIKAHQD